jgi:hypothetical protein
MGGMPDMSQFAQMMQNMNPGGNGGADGMGMGANLPGTLHGPVKNQELGIGIRN